MSNTVANDWDEASPALSSPRREGAAEITSLRAGVRLRLSREHETPAAAGVGGEHKAGSAKAYRQSSAPTQRPDASTSLGSADAGRMWLDSDNNKLYVWSGAAWVEIVPTVDNIRHFEKITDGGLAVASLPMQETGLDDGVWQVNVYGTLSGSPGEGTSYTMSVTVNGSTRSLVIDNHPDGTAPFVIPMTVTVSGGTITISAASNVSRILGMMGVRVG